MDEKQMEKEIYNLNLKNQGIMLEYQYVCELKNKNIKELQEKESIVEEENEKLKENEKKLKEKNLSLEEENNKLKEEIRRNIKQYENSTSWKVTRPLRFIGKIIKK